MGIVFRFEEGPHFDGNVLKLVLEGWWQSITGQFGMRLRVRDADRSDNDVLAYRQTSCRGERG